MRIHQVKTRLVNTYVIEYPERLFVMDVAVGCHRYVLGFIEQELNRDIHDVELVICSHDDPDHMGGVTRLAALCDAAIAIPLSSGVAHHKFWNDPVGVFVRTITALQEGFRGRMWDMYFNPKRSVAARKKPKYTGKKNHGLLKKRRNTLYRLQGGTLPGFHDWKVIHTPGHSWDSCCYYHADSGSLLSGDTLLGSAKQEKVVVPSIYANSEQMKSSLAGLRKLAIQSVYPGHGSIISHDISF
jgi:glyoxylase-like metal-dependent hydrolase (beta-lactamase superfamily II)